MAIDWGTGSYLGGRKTTMPVGVSGIAQAMGNQQVQPDVPVYQAQVNQPQYVNPWTGIPTSYTPANTPTTTTSAAPTTPAPVAGPAGGGVGPGMVLQTPSMSNESFSTSGTPGANWRNFTFANPTTGFQQNFNYLAKINPDLAFSYLGGNYGGTEGWNQFQNAFGPGAGAVWNTFNPGGNEAGSAQRTGLGITDPNFQPYNLQLDANRNFTFGGQSYQLPGQTQQISAQTDPNAFLAANPYQQAAEPGSAEWYRGIQSRYLGG